MLTIAETIFNNDKSIYMKRILFVALFFCCFGFCLAQIPEGYYDAAVGLKGSALKSALHSIIKTHKTIGYKSLYGCYSETDAKPNNKVWDIYSDVPGGKPPYEFDFGSDECGNYKYEGDCYNKEHTVPKSWFNDASPMYSDLMHVLPTDGKVNGMRGNYAYGEVSNPTWTSLNGSKVGKNTVSGNSSTVFEPIDEYKGDIARIYFYMSVCYSDKNMGQEGNSMFSGSNIKDWALKMLLRWNEQDPVSQKEINRNNAVYGLQENRNPFVDYPQLVDLVFGSLTDEEFYPNGKIYKVDVFDTICDNETITYRDVKFSRDTVAVFKLHTDECDSIITYHLKVWPTYEIDVYDTVKMKDLPFKYNGVQFEKDTLVVFELSTVHDCDSVVNYHFTVDTSTVDIQNYFKESHFTVYPNPANDEVFITTSSQDVEAVQNVSLFDVQGRLLYKEAISVKPQELIKINLSSCKSGCYFIKIDYRQGSETHKIIVR